MADDIKGKVQEVGHKVAEKAKEVGHKIGEGVEKAADWTKEKVHQAGHRIDEAKQKVGHAAQETFGSSSGTAISTADVRERMDVIGSCGNKLGVVDHVEGSRIKLTKNDSPDGQHHFVPLAWVSRIDDRVHLSKNCGDAKKEWQAA